MLSDQRPVQGSLIHHTAARHIHKEDALSIKPKMVKIALDHELIGEV